MQNNGSKKTHPGTFIQAQMTFSEFMDEACCESGHGGLSVLKKMDSPLKKESLGNSALPIIF